MVYLVIENATLLLNDRTVYLNGSEGKNIPNPLPIIAHYIFSEK